MRLSIRPCLERDLMHLDETFPLLEGHRHRLDLQLAGEETYLLAWSEEALAGHVMIRWRGSRHQHVGRRQRGVPEISRLAVAPRFRRCGVGTGLLRAAEMHAALRGFNATGLAVGVDNEPALRLYRKAGYVPTNIPCFESPFGVDSDGSTRTHLVTYLVKPLDVSAIA